jgi:Family of unknown function (DUF5309)
MSTANLDSADLKAVTRNGLIREDVMSKIWDISKIPLPFTDLVGSETHKNSYVEWTTDALAAPDLANSNVDGADASGNDTRSGLRVGNHSQISDKIVRVSFRADASDTVGRAKELAYQISRRQQELKRDVDAIALLNQASVADDGNTTAGKVGGLPSWLASNNQGGTAGGFATGTGLTVARIPTANRALTETMIRKSVQDVYQNGGDSSVLMTSPGVVGQISAYLFSSSARIATLMSDIEGSAAKATAMGAVNVFVTDFGTLQIRANRLQPVHKDSGTTDVYDVFILDPSYLALSYLDGYRTEDLAKIGLANNRQMSVDWSLKVFNEKSQAIIGDINPATAMTA